MQSEAFGLHSSGRTGLSYVPDLLPFVSFKLFQARSSSDERDFKLLKASSSSSSPSSSSPRALFVFLELRSTDLAFSSSSSLSSSSLFFILIPRFRYFNDQAMNPDVPKLRKRKFLVEDAEETSLPTAKHKCSETGTDSGSDLLFTAALDTENVSCDMDILNLQGNSAQDSNSFPGDSRLYLEMKYDTSSQKNDSYDEASTSWSNSKLSKSQHSSSYSESGFLDDTVYVKEDMITAGGEKSPHLDAGWDDTDFLDELSAEYCNDGKQQRAEDVGEFLFCSGMNPSLYMLSSERFSVDQEAQLERRKPTIDQEFEQYFSMLML